MWEISANNHICHSKPPLYFLDFRSLYISLPPKPSTLCVSLLFFLYVCLFSLHDDEKPQSHNRFHTYLGTSCQCIAFKNMLLVALQKFDTTKIYTQKCKFFTPQKRV